MLNPDAETVQPAPGSDGSMRVDRESLTLRERTADAIRQAIIDHRLPPGMHLKERELCEMLGVSRTSVREALRHLESEHLIETVPHRGPMVVSLTAAQARDLYRVRAALEGLVGELFAEHASDAHIDRLRNVAREMAIEVSQERPDVILATIERFYGVLYEGTGNRVCAQLVNSLNSRVATFRRLALASTERRSEMMKDVELIVAAAEARDAEALKKACVQHVETACAAVMRQLAASEAEQ